MHDYHELSGMALFADLGPAHIERTHQAFTEQWFEPGERAQRQGIAGTGFHVILDGEAEWHVDDQLVDSAVAVTTRPITLKRGDWFGELSILFDEPADADVVAVTALHCLVLPARELRGFLFDHPEVMYRMLLGEARRLRDPEWHR